MVSESPSFSQPELVKRREPGPGENDGPPVTTSEDVANLNRKYAMLRERDHAYRVHQAFFRCPWPISQRHYERIKYSAVTRWLADQEQRGWVLKSKVADSVKRRRLAHGYSGDFVAGAILGEVEIPVLGLFEKENPKPMRIEVPVAS